MLNKYISVLISIISILISFLFLNTKEQVLINSIIAIISILLWAGKSYELKLKQIFSIIFISVLVFFVVVISGAFLRAYNRMFYELLIYGLYTVLLFYCSKNKSYNFYSILVSLYLSIGLVFSINFKFGSINILPISGSGIIALIIITALFFVVNKKLKYLLYILFSLTISYYLYPQYIQLVNKKENLRNINNSIVLIDSNKKQINLDTLNKKVIVLDFWYSRCASCFEGFPNYQALYNQYKSNSKVLIGVVNVELEGVDTANEAYSLINKYMFDKFKTPLTMDSLKQTIALEKYPTVYVFDKEKRLRYSGAIQYNSGINNIHDIINKILKE
jgi:thiol-disulfide isomerase/thioredoxin